MTNIAVISDTHIPKKAKELPQPLLEGISGVDMIIHAGDICSDYVLYELEEIAPVTAVAGNNDDEYLHSLLKRHKIIDIENCKIGIIHGDGLPGRTPEREMKAFAGDKVNCIVFGHSHKPFLEYIDRILLLNPGSPTDRRRQQLFSYAILKVDTDSITAGINYF